ncbi:haloacid dehalogenase superfamily enzyme, subfamily IA [Hoeflea sp. IMCC20628]|uniref:HAD-IA family hydrolase n=1 Tax=Hoeflea sp. IMCC20628 TaxID=1620421 RepID=UPI00063AFA80|nr:HAD-IA family hydrolase [Hoeflea sp. IMCC20628]AKI00896.1 haloacid dehalogenase superfamily enzyme, subfamily IA [Hoeflea sp. IMCC20628]
MKLALFDCDGTIVDSAAVIHACMERTFEDFEQARPGLELTKSIIGLTLDIAIGQMLNRIVDPEITAMTARYKEHFMLYRQSGGLLEPAYEGLLPLIAALAARDDVILGVVTGKSRRGLDAILAHHDLTQSFFVTRTADDCPSKPHPAMVLECCAAAGIEPGQTTVIGDAVYDMQMAVNAGARAVGVSWGYGPVDALTASGAHHVVTTADEIATLI